MKTLSRPLSRCFTCHVASKLLLAPLWLAALLSLAACSTTESGGERGSALKEPVEVRKGMKAEDLLAALGEPYEIREATPPTEGTEIWVYRKVDENVALVVSGTVETPGLDIGGVQMTITDNVYTPATTRTVEETLFLVVEGVMIAWKVQRDDMERLN